MGLIQLQEGRTASLFRIFFGARGRISPNLDDTLSGVARLVDLAPVQGRGLLGIGFGETAPLAVNTFGRIRYRAPEDRESWIDSIQVTFTDDGASRLLELEFNSATVVVGSGTVGVGRRDTRQTVPNAGQALGTFSASETGAGSGGNADARWRLIAPSPPIELAPNGIMLAAGSSIDVILGPATANDRLAATIAMRTFQAGEFGLNPLTP